jgi:hypothetical protein
MLPTYMGNLLRYLRSHKTYITISPNLSMLSRLGQCGWFILLSGTANLFRYRVSSESANDTVRLEDQTLPYRTLKKGIIQSVSACACVAV